MVVGEALTPVTVYDVVFVVEGTANVGAYFDNLKTSYIQPTLEYFNGGQMDEVDYGCSANCTLYTLVTFHGSDRAPSSLSTCLEPTTSTHQFLRSLDRIDFASGYGDSASHMAEGLSTALQLFDDLEKIRDPNTKAQQHCILVCNSAPYALPSDNSVSYSGHTTETLISILGERGVNFSIISPRKIPVLYKLFDLGCTDPSTSSSNAKNYTTDSRHLVLIKGHQLPERAMSPSAIKPEAVRDDKPNITNSIRGQNPTLNQPVNVTGPMNPVVPVLPATRPSIIPRSNPAMDVAIKIMDEAKGGRVRPQVGPGGNFMLQPASAVSMPDGNMPGGKPIGGVMRPQNPSQPINPSQMPRMIQPPHGGAFPGMNYPSGIGNPNTTGNPNVTGNPNLVVNSNTGQNPNMSLNPNLSGGGHNNLNTGMMPGMIQNSSGMDVFSGPNNLLTGINPNNPGPHLEAAVAEQTNKLQEQKLIWAGTLEWHEKAKAGEVGPRLARSLACQILVGVEDAEINASGWVNKMTMNLIPSVLLSPLHNLFKNSRTVNFQFGKQDLDSLSSLYRVMAGGFGGCIHIQTVTNAPANPTDVRVLMLLFSQRKHQFMGLIPTDQSRFVQGIRSVINKHKQQQERTKMQNTVGGAPFNGGNGFPGGIGSVPGQQVSPPMGGGTMTAPMAAASQGGGGMGGNAGGVGGLNIGMSAPMMSGVQIQQHNQQQQQQQIQQQQLQQQASGPQGPDEQDHRNLFQQLQVDQQRQQLQQQQQQQFLAQQHHQRIQQQQQQQQQQQMQQQLQQQQQQSMQQVNQQSMQASNQPLRNLLQQQQIRHMMMQQQQQQQQQMRARVPGPQGQHGGQQVMPPGMGQMQSGQNFGSITDDLGLDFGGI